MILLQWPYPTPADIRSSLLEPIILAAIVVPLSLDSLPDPSIRSTEDIVRQMERPIALIGNGAVGKPYGSLIDSHPTVIRCNNFEIRGYEAWVGTKITHWCHHGVIDRLSFQPRWQQRFVELFNPHRNVGIKINPYVLEEIPSICPKPYDWTRVEPSRRCFGRDLMCLQDASLLYSLCAAVEYPTTGLAMLHVLLQFQPEVNLFGFSGLAGGHYWKKKHRHSKRHVPTGSKELEIIRATARAHLYE